jgi:UDP-2,3-diacylglucosamine pyrophosphatase LpxH
MLVIISDLHLTDGTSGETIRTGAFTTFRERIRDLAYDASWRSEKKYAPIECVDLVLLGDIIDVIRSSRWCEAGSGLRPWGDRTSPGFADMVARITEDAIANNRASLDVLRSLHDPKVMNVPPGGGDGKLATISRNLNAKERVPVPVRIHYLVGNHDWFFHLKGPAYDAIRKQIVDAIGLANDPDVVFPHDPDESALIGQVYREHRVFARHGDIFDPGNFEHDRDASSLGDAIVVELLNRFAIEVRKRLGDELPEACEAGFREIDNVRPLSMIPVWVDGLVQRTCTEELATQVKQIWNQLVHDFLKVDFVRERPFGSSALIKLGFEISSDLSLTGLSDVVTWFSAKMGGRAETFYPYAMHERAFKEGWARFIVYGHTHHYEIVPLRSEQRDGETIDTLYINSGTWRPVHELARFHAVQKQFVRYHVMTYLSFFKDEERKGREFEVWSGALGSSAA